MYTENPVRECGVVSLYGTWGVCNKEVHPNSENFKDWLGHKSFWDTSQGRLFPLNLRLSLPLGRPDELSNALSVTRLCEEKTAPTLSGKLPAPSDNGRGRAEETFNKHRGGIIDVLKVLEPMKHSSFGPRISIIGTSTTRTLRAKR